MTLDQVITFRAYIGFEAVDPTGYYFAVYRSNMDEPVDHRQIVCNLRETGYRSYAPLETLRPGDPREKVRRFLGEFRKALAGRSS